MDIFKYQPYKNKLHKDYFSGLHFPTMDLTVWIKSENLLHVLPRSAGSEEKL